MTGQTIFFEQMNTGAWETIDDGLTTTAPVTRDSGLADTYFVPPRTTFADLRISFAGNNTFASVDTTFTVTIDLGPPSFQIIDDLVHTRRDGIPLILVHGRSGEGQFTKWNIYLEYVRQNPTQFAEFDIYV